MMVFLSRVILIKISMQYYPTESIKTSHNTGLRRFKHLESFLGTLLSRVSDFGSVHNIGCAAVFEDLLYSTIVVLKFPNLGTPSHSENNWGLRDILFMWFMLLFTVLEIKPEILKGFVHLFKIAVNSSRDYKNNFFMKNNYFKTKIS